MPVPDESGGPEVRDTTDDAALPDDAHARGEPGGRRTGRPPVWALAGLAAAATVALLGLAMTLGGAWSGSAPLTPPPGHSPSARYFSCVQPDPPLDGGYCGRLAQDVARRSDLTAAQRDRLAPTTRRVEAAIDWPGFCAGIHLPPHASTAGSPTAPPVTASPGRLRSWADCAGWQRPDRDGTEPADLPDVAAVHRSLDEAGFAGATVRIAGVDDPAPRGTILYAVPLDDACLIGYRATLRGGGGYTLAGRLPQGTCLAR